MSAMCHNGHHIDARFLLKALSELPVRGPHRQLLIEICLAQFATANGWGRPSDEDFLDALGISIDDMRKLLAESSRPTN